MDDQGHRALRYFDATELKQPLPLELEAGGSAVRLPAGTQLHLFPQGPQEVLQAALPSDTPIAVLPADVVRCTLPWVHARHGPAIGLARADRWLAAAVEPVTLAGRVLRQDGKSLGGVRIATVFPDPAARRGVRIVNASLTRPNGEFTLAMPAGEAELAFLVEPFRAPITIQPLAGDPEADLEVQVAAAGTLAARVVDGAGEPLVGVAVALQLPGPIPLWNTRYSDSGGEVIFRSLPAGRYADVRVTAGSPLEPSGSTRSSDNATTPRPSPTWR